MTLKRKLNSLNRVLGFILLASLLILVSIAIYSDIKINRSDGYYSVGKVTNVGRGKRANPFLKYYFYYQGKLFNGKLFNQYKLKGLTDDSLKGYIGKRYMVKFVKDYPKINRLKLDLPACVYLDTLKSWNYIPKDCN